MSSVSYYFTGYVWRPERRRHPRVRTDIMLSIERLDGHGRVGHIMDMSLGGVRLQSVGHRLIREEVVRLAFNMGGDMFIFFAKAIRIKKLDAFSQEVTLAFTGMDPERREVLQRNLYPNPPEPS